MSIRQGSLPIPIRQHGWIKENISQETPPSLNNSYVRGSLSPRLSAPTPPNFTPSKPHAVSRIGRYVFLEQTDVSLFRAVDSVTEQEFKVKVVPVSKYQEVFSPHFAVDQHPNINNLSEVLLGDNQAYGFYQVTYGDIHTYIRGKRKLKEPEAAKLFHQIVSSVAHCHSNGVVLRDLKLRKFVFSNMDKTQVVLDGLEDAFVLDQSGDDSLQDKHGCPAYVAPEILNVGRSYSGKCADVWSLGVILYTMLVGRYPFHHSELATLFTKIRQGSFVLPDSLSPLAKCLLHSILRVDPSDRLTAEEILEHPWFHAIAHSSNQSFEKQSKSNDQLVPDVVFHTDEEEGFFL